jgi:hypothetical protein
MNERERFEKFIVEEKGWTVEVNFNDGKFLSYVRDDVQYCWEVWQAALASQEPAYWVDMSYRNAHGYRLAYDTDPKTNGFMPVYTSPQAQPDLQDARIKQVCYYALNRFIHDHDTGKKIFTNDDVENYTIEAMKAKG